MDDEPQDFAALDRAMAERRDEVRKRWTAVAGDAGMTAQHLHRIRRGQVPLTNFAARGLDVALGWPAGTAMSYYRTGRAPAVADRPRAGSPEWWEGLARQLPPEMFREVVEAAKAGRVELTRRLINLIESTTDRDNDAQSGVITPSE